MSQNRPDLLLALDVGSQSIRALAFNPSGDLVAQGHSLLEPCRAEQPGWAEQDCHYFWQTLVAAVHNLLRQGILTQDIAAMALTCQRGTVVNLDKNGSPLRPAISWMDQRIVQPTPMSGAWPHIFRLIGHRHTLDYFRAQSEANWIAQQQPQVWHSTAKFLLLSGYLNFRLTGRYRDSTANTVGYLPFDYKKQQWAGPRDWKWQALPIHSSQLPELIAPGEVLGLLQPEAAEELGLPTMLKVISAASDKACETLGCGVTAPDSGALSLGTTATINVVQQRYQETVPMLPPYPAATPGAWSNEIMVYRGFWMVRWFKEQFGHSEMEQAAGLGCAAEVLFEKLLQRTPPGNKGLILQPFWNPGLIYPGVEARGSLIGFTADHDRAHVYRAIIEGLAYALRFGISRLQKRTGISIKRFIAAGGGANSAGVLQIFADVLGHPISKPHTHEASGLGAAINMAVALGLHPDYETAVIHMVRLTEAALPCPENMRIYTQQFETVYRDLYRRLRPLYRRMFNARH